LRREDLYGEWGRWDMVCGHQCAGLCECGPSAVACCRTHATPGRGADRAPLRLSRQVLREYLTVVTRPQRWSTPQPLARAL